MTVNMHEAKTHLSRLVERAIAGETIVIARAGRPVAKLVGLDDAENISRIGFLEGRIRVPDDFNEMGRDEIADMFGVGGG